jgi:twitching motility protein PilT
VPEVDARIRVSGFASVAPSGSINAVKARGPRAEAVAPLGKVRVFRTSAPIGLRELLQLALERDATDLHVKGMSPVRARVGGALVALGDRPLDPDEADALVRELLSPEQYAEFQRKGDLDLAYAFDERERFRVNVYRARKIAGFAARRIPDKVPTIDSLGLSPGVGTLALKPRGLVLVAGPAGAGKSTTLAAMVHHVNQARACHIVTLEDPIEFLHREAKAQITQREIGDDTEELAAAFRRALRQDPDVILVGEMPDLATVRLAVGAAESGHLVLAAARAATAVGAIERIVDAFPQAEQRQVRHQLADGLQGVIAQTLLPRVNGGFVVAQEILVATDGVRAAIRDGKSVLAGAKDGMQTLEDSLNDLLARGLITFESAVAKAHHPKQVAREGKPLRPAM